MLHDNSSNEADEKGPARYRGGIDVAERVKEKRCCIIHNYYICPVCKTGYCKPFGEAKTRPVQKCKKCNKTVRMIIREENPGRQQPCWGHFFCTNITQPTGALDARNSEKLMEMFTEINEKFKTTIVMVTHDPFSVSYCNHIFFLKNGKISYELYKGARGKEQYLAAILDAQNI